VISTVAGTGNTCGDADDGSPATSAQLCPNTESGSLALDAQGRLLISDRGQAVRRVKADGTMGTLIAYPPPTQVGSPPVVATGMAADSAGNVYVVDSGGAVDRIDSSGNLYVFDPSAGNSVREITTGGLVRTVARDSGPSPSCGSGPAAFAVINGLQRATVNQSGDVFLISYCALHRYTDGVVATVDMANGCPSTPLVGPFWSIRVDASGYIYLGDVQK